MTYLLVTAAAAALGVAFAAFAGAFGLARATSSALESMARQPEIAGQISTSFIIGAAFIEALTIYALVVGILLWLRLPSPETLIDLVENMS